MFVRKCLKLYKRNLSFLKNASVRFVTYSNITKKKQTTVGTTFLNKNYKLKLNRYLR